MKRSQWFKGLLCAEQWHKDGYTLIHVSDSSSRFRDDTTWLRWSKDGKIHSVPFYARYATEYIQGVVDYQEHLKRLEEFK